jgi:hypothetical protein
MGERVRQDQRVGGVLTVHRARAVTDRDGGGP